MASAHGAVRRAREAGAEQGVDGDRAAVQTRRRERLDVLDALGVGARVAAQLLDAARRPGRAPRARLSRSSRAAT